jgi:serine/threonine-protein kinase HipA
LALTLNGKKRKLNRNDFEKAFIQSGLDTKVTNSIFLRFEKLMHQWQMFIKSSPFLTKQLKKDFSRFIADKWKTFEYLPTINESKFRI